MKFGLMQLVSGQQGKTAGETYRENLDLAVMAEQCGFDSVWVAEHHFTDYGLVPNTLQYLAALATVTTRIRLGTGVVVTPLHNPIRMAEEVAFLDQLSEGRVDVGVGRGYQPGEFRAFGSRMEESRDRFEESIAFLRRAWGSDEAFDWDGRFFQGAQIAIQPRPVQQPHPPMWLACTSPPTFELAGQQGWQILTSPNFSPIQMVQDNFALYYKNLKDAGYDRTSFEFPMMQQVYVGADADAAYAEPEQACMAYFKQLGRLLPDELTPGDGEGGESYDQMRRTKQRIAKVRYDYLWDNAVAFGDSARVIDRLESYREDLDMDYFIGWFNFADLDHDRVVASLRRFADEVMPHFDAPGA